MYWDTEWVLVLAESVIDKQALMFLCHYQRCLAFSLLSLSLIQGKTLLICFFVCLFEADEAIIIMICFLYIFKII